MDLILTIARDLLALGFIFALGWIWVQRANNRDDRQKLIADMNSAKTDATTALQKRLDDKDEMITQLKVNIETVAMNCDEKLSNLQADLDEEVYRSGLYSRASRTLVHSWDEALYFHGMRRAGLFIGRALQRIDSLQAKGDAIIAKAEKIDLAEKVSIRPFPNGMALASGALAAYEGVLEMQDSDEWRALIDKIWERFGDRELLRTADRGGRRGSRSGRGGGLEMALRPPKKKDEPSM